MPLPEPKGRQREVLYLPATGHVVVLGTAGSGKTTLAIHRAAYLAATGTDHAGPTLLLTFNKTLIAYLKSISDGRLRNVVVENYHVFARGYLNSRGRMYRNAILSWPQERDELIRQAVAEIQMRSAPDTIFARPLLLFSEEVRWLAQHGIATLEDYMSTTRTGRAEARMERKDRAVAWKIYDAYRALRHKSGRICDWDDIASIVSAELDLDGSSRRYRHIVIDEGQDLSPEMIRSLTKAVPDNGSLTFFGDVAQQIYGHRMSWRSAGIQVTDTWLFKENYRNTKQISRLALAITRMPFYRGVPDIVEPTSPTADGPLPTLVQCRSLEDELRLVAEQARSAAATQTVAILLPTWDDKERLAKLLPRNAVHLQRDMNHWPRGPTLMYGTYHSAKGLEFDVVILPHLSQNRFPDPELIASLGKQEAEMRDGRLLYVGVTRARTNLILTYTGALTNLLPVDPSLYTKVAP